MAPVVLPLKKRIMKSLMRYSSGVLRKYTVPGFKIPKELLRQISKIDGWEGILLKVIDAREKLEDESGAFSVDTILIRGIPKGSKLYDHACFEYKRKIEFLSLCDIAKETRMKDDYTEMAMEVFETVLRRKVRGVMTRITADFEKEEVGMEGVITLRRDLIGGDLTCRIMKKILGDEKVTLETIENGSLKSKVSALGRKYPDFFDKLVDNPRSVIISKNDERVNRTTKSSKKNRKMSGPTKAGIEKVVANFYAALRS